ncbi:Cloroperoxidase [Heliocybe sulcata]|uniref:Cloroperoxidase n=1 Tax=Heliocybe sulcata TaxID=5364 RepID=A0A5C3NBA6_9AGAM|nr:Cloroperoxidase [Heliocybe sulcata]
MDQLSMYNFPLNLADRTLIIPLTALLGSVIVYMSKTLLFSKEKSLPEDHPFIPRTKTDSRAPCPALNALANHGYLPRNGRTISQWDLIRALRQGYNCSLPLALFLTWGGYLLLAQFGHITLDDLRRHGYIEHIASLAHGDPNGDEEYAPNTVILDLMDDLMKDGRDGHLDALAVARARVSRESSYSIPIDGLHAEVARGEMALVLGIFGGEEERVDLEMLRQWFVQEKFPPNWKPAHRQTLWQTVKTAARIRRYMKDLRGNTEDGV